jgi:hypothetical protein
MVPERSSTANGTETPNLDQAFAKLVLTSFVVAVEQIVDYRSAIWYVRDADLTHAGTDSYVAPHPELVRSAHKIWYSFGRSCKSTVVPGFGQLYWN